jgi:hypothetical protein
VTEKDAVSVTPDVTRADVAATAELVSECLAKVYTAAAVTGEAFLALLRTVINMSRDGRDDSGDC